MNQAAVQRLPAGAEPDSLLRTDGEAAAIGTAKAKVCVFADDPLLKTIRPKLAQLGYQIVECNGKKRGKAIAVVVSSAFDADLSLCRSLTARGNVILLADRNDFEFRLDAARAGIEAILWPPHDMVELSHWLNHFAVKEQQRYTILVVDDDEIAAHAYAAALRSSGMDTHVVTDPRIVPERISATEPDLVLLDMQMPQADGLELAKIIRQSRRNISLPIVFLSAERDVNRQIMAREVGGDLFISKPIDLALLVSLIRLRAERAVLLREIMERDSLTGLVNHAGFKERVASELERGRRTGSPLTICLLDIDHFKSVNDRHGHQAGDHVIQSLSHALSGALRRTDIVARYGGEEFGVILLDATPESARQVMEKVRKTIGSQRLETPDGDMISITVSVGVAGAGPQTSVQDLIGAADKALYEAKATGRNRVVLA